MIKLTLSQRNSGRLLHDFVSLTALASDEALLPPLNALDPPLVAVVWAQYLSFVRRTSMTINSKAAIRTLLLLLLWARLLRTSTAT